MAKAQEKTTSQGYKVKEKLSVEKLDLTKQEVGFVFAGKYMHQYEGDEFEQLNEETKEKETKRLTFCVFEYMPGEGTGRFECIADKGLLTVLKQGMVQKNDYVQITKLGKKSIGGKKTMNTYELHSIELVD